MIKKHSVFASEIKNALDQGEDQYFLKPRVLSTDCTIKSKVKDGDAIIFCCRRGEREVQLTRAFVDQNFNEFPHEKWDSLYFATFTKYHEMFDQVPTVFPPVQDIYKGMGELISEAGYRQLRVAESEKFNHITVFLNGGRNTALAGEDRVRIPSHRGIAFDQVPEMKSDEVTQAVIEGLDSGKYHFVAVNFANGDVIGHLDNFKAKVKCVEAIDACLGRVLERAAANGFSVIITADHGLLELGYHKDGSQNLHHTSNLVPLLIHHPAAESRVQLRQGGILSDIAPTVLDLMGIEKPPEMPRNSLLVKEGSPDYGNSKVLLIILDGWGIGEKNESNPIFLADTPHFDSVCETWASTHLKASGEAVGLLERNPGNSEAGHSNIGAGHIVLQDEVRIEQAIKNNSLQDNLVIQEALAHAKKNQSNLHLISFFSHTSSHGTIYYPLEVLKLAKHNGLNSVKIHAIFNRPNGDIDAAPRMIQEMENEIEEIGLGEIVSAIGRGLALDRDANYKKTKLAYDAIVYGHGKTVESEPEK